jgi:hypothetical protein
MKYIKKFESSEEPNNYSEIKDNLEDLLYDFKDIGCEYVFLEEKGDDGIVYTINLQIYPPNFSTREEVFLNMPIKSGKYDIISHGNPYSNEYIGEQIIDKSILFLDNQIQFNELFKDLLIRINRIYENKISFIGIKDKYYNIGLSIS